VCFGDVVESEYTPAELEEKVCAEGYEGPERELQNSKYINDSRWTSELTTGTISLWIFSGKETTSMKTAR
jgi:hypothetical protein